jgi:hypothetical protein
MAITEDQRHDLFEGLIRVLGREKATTLMEHLPPVGWADVATKRDLDHQAAVFRRDLEIETGKVRSEMHTGFTGLRAEMQHGFTGLRAEMQADSTSIQTELADLRADSMSLRADSTSLRAEMHTGFAELRAEVAALEVRVERALREQSRTFFLGILAANATLAGLAFGAAHLA